MTVQEADYGINVGSRSDNRYYHYTRDGKGQVPRVGMCQKWISGNSDGAILEWAGVFHDTTGWTGDSVGLDLGSPALMLIILH